MTEEEIQTAAKIYQMPSILAAAKLLEGHGLLKGQTANEAFRDYLLANPDINEMLIKTGHKPLATVW